MGDKTQVNGSDYTDRADAVGEDTGHSRKGGSYVGQSRKGWN